MHRGQKVIVRCFGDVQEAYWGMASALSEADGIDYTDPEEVSVWECINIYAIEFF